MSAQSYTATLYYSVELYGKVSRYYTLKQFGTTTAVCIFLLTFAVLGFFWFGLTMPGYQIACSVIVGSIIFYFWYRYEVRRRWLAAMNAMGKPEAMLIVDDESFTVSSGAGSSMIPWRRFEKIWKQPDFWMLFLVNSNTPMTIPLEGVDSKVLELIDEKIADAKKFRLANPAP